MARVSTEEIGNTISSLEDLHKRLIADVSQELNKYHCVNYPVSFWDQLIGQWVLHFSHVLAACITFSDQRQAASGTEQTVWLSENIPKTTLEFINTSKTQKFYSQFGSILNSLVDSSALKITVDSPDHLGNISRKSIIEPRGLRSFINLNLNQNHAGSQDSILFASNPFLSVRDLCQLQEALLPRFRCIAPPPILWRKTLSSVIDIQYRFGEFNKLAVRHCKQSSPIELIYFMFRLFWRVFLPISYLENFEYLSNFTKRWLNRVGKISFVVTKDTIGLDPIGHITALAGMSGAKLIVSQHGGNYGLDKLNPSENFEKNIADRFVSWGWEEATNYSKVVPLPFPTFNAKLKTTIQFKPATLVVLQDYPPYPHRLNTWPSFEGAVEHHKEVNNFVRRITQIGSDVIVRCPRIKEYPEENINHISTVNKLDANDLPLWQQATKFDLVIHLYFGTSWLETLSLGIPTICWVSPQYYALRETFIGEYTIGKEVGIFYEDINEIESVLRKNRTQIYQWWNSTSTKNIRRKIERKYVWREVDYYKHWVKMFNETSLPEQN
jgi:putative transferase (TIGR04331 family)